jgi:dTDP-4-dehydrorhamnose 3,5-epimerase
MPGSDLPDTAMPSSEMPNSEMEPNASAIDGLFVIRLKQVGDARGTVREFYRRSAWVDAGLPDVGPWQQMNVTETRQGSLRGLHGEAMDKLVGVVHGEAFGAYVDLRRDSPSFGAVVTTMLVAGVQVLVPNGVGNGFQAVSPGGCQYFYCFDREWQPGMAGVSVSALDPALGIRWPLPIDPSDLSERDRTLPTFAEYRDAG